MSNYSRFISYLFHYDMDGKKVNAGHARVEVKQDMCKISIHVKQNGGIDTEIEVFYYARGSGNLIKTVKLGSISLIKGEGTAIFELNVKNINQSNISFNNVNGVLLFKEGYDGYITADWDEHELSPAQVASLYKKNTADGIKAVLDNNLYNISSKISPIADISEEISTTNYQAMPNNNISVYKKNVTPKVIISDIKDLSDKVIISDIDKIIDKIEIVGKKREPDKKVITNIKMEQDKITTADVERKSDEIIITDIKRKPDEIIIADINREPDSNINWEPESNINIADAFIDELKINMEYDDKPLEETASEKSVSAAEAVSVKEAIKNIDDEFLEIAATDSQEVKKWPKNARSEDLISKNLYGKKMPWQDAKEAREILDNNERMHPFQDGEIAECVKIEPKDIGKLPVEFWVLGNNSFLLHSYCNYKYLLFAKRMNRIKCEYLLMVPGVYQHREKVMAKMFGFEHFKCVRCREQRVGEFGYWYMSISF